MKKTIVFLSLSLFLFLPNFSNATSVVINGSDYLQSFSVSNDSGFNITRVVYSLGTAANGIATWDTRTGGGVASNSLSNPRWFQTVTWSGLSVSTGNTFSIPAFSLDIDWITTLSPLSINEGTIDNVGTSLNNAFFGVEYNDGFGLRTVELNETGWTVSQRLIIGGGNGEIPIPEPTTMLLLGVGLIGLAGYAKKRMK